MRHNKGERVWFTGDTHFSHKLLAQLRGFPNLAEMDESLVLNWNSRVEPRDIVYHLGDVAFGRPQWALPLLNRLNGRIRLIEGNHDHIASHPICRGRFEWIKQIYDLSFDRQKIVLCHYPMRSWNCSSHGSWMLHGHCHGKLTDDPKLMSIDVGVDCFGMHPISFDVIEGRMREKISRQTASSLCSTSDV